MEEKEKMNAMIESVKRALGYSDSDFDEEFEEYILQAVGDLGFTNINQNKIDLSDINIKRAVITYCKMNFGHCEDSEYKRLERSYFEQKAQMQMSSKYSFGE